MTAFADGPNRQDRDTNAMASTWLRERSAATWLCERDDMSLLA
jgi:hypothetical protein